MPEMQNAKSMRNRKRNFKFGVVGVFEFWLVGAGVLDGPPTFPEKFVVG